MLKLLTKAELASLTNEVLKRDGFSPMTPEEAQADYEKYREAKAPYTITQAEFAVMQNALRKEAGLEPMTPQEKIDDYAEFLREGEAQAW